MIRQLVDILATLMEAGLLYYVMSKDIKREFKRECQKSCVFGSPCFPR